MADVAQKLEQLKMAMGSNTTQDDAFLSHLASNTVHYNPADLSNLLESMLFELNAPPPPLPSCTPIPNHQSNQFELPPIPTVSASILDLTDCSTMTTVDFPNPWPQAEYNLKPASYAALNHVVHGSKPRRGELQGSKLDEDLLLFLILVPRRRVWCSRRRRDGIVDAFCDGGVVDDGGACSRGEKEQTALLGLG